MVRQVSRSCSRSTNVGSVSDVAPRLAWGAPISSIRPFQKEGTPLEVLGSDLVVPLVTGERVRYVNLDYAASAPCLREVNDLVSKVLPWYSAVHRGSGFASTVMSERYEGARATIRDFVGGRPDDAVVFTRNTTEALNLLARALPQGATVVTFGSEHHANLLPWRSGDPGRRAIHLPIPTSADEAVELVERALSKLARERREPSVLSVAGASNVTGEVFPLARLSSIAHAHGARFVVDAAQLAPHRPIDMTALDIDYLALSGHKLYAPFGSGVLIGRPDWLDRAPPHLAGGGAVARVTLDDVLWRDGAAKHEGGSPNVIGAVALAAACEALLRVGMARVRDHETALTHELTVALRARSGVSLLSMWGGESDRIGIATFTARGWAPGALAAALSAEYGIGVRAGTFCAEPLLRSMIPLLTGGAECGAEGAVRVSFGVGTRSADISRFMVALDELLERGPRWTYGMSDGRYVPVPDPRPRPSFGGV